MLILVERTTIALAFILFTIFKQQIILLNAENCLSMNVWHSVFRWAVLTHSINSIYFHFKSLIYTLIARDVFF